MSLIDTLNAYFTDEGLGVIHSAEAVSGGCINDAQKIVTTTGATFIAKYNLAAPRTLFACESDGLQLLRLAAAPRVPLVYCYSEHFILLEYLTPAPLRSDAWAHFGRQLAALHQHTHSAFGFEQDNYIGSAPQRNTWEADGYTFFAEHRLGVQGKIARDKGLLTPTEVRQLAQLSAKLRDLIPLAAACRVHGDLWHGNIIPGPAGQLCLIDPAAHYGWAEADLAMTTLFGTLPNDFYAAYLEAHPMPAGWRARFEIYNLYHLLNHLNLFGRSYLSAVQTTLRKFQ